MGALWQHLKQMDVPWPLKELAKPTIVVVGTAIAAAVVAVFYFLWGSLAPVAALLLEPLPIPALVLVLVLVAVSWATYKLGGRRATVAQAPDPNHDQVAEEELSEALAASTPPPLTGSEEVANKTQPRWYRHFGLDWKLKPQFIEQHDELEVLRTGYSPDYWVLGPNCPACKRDASQSVTEGRNACQHQDCEQRFRIPLPSRSAGVKLDELKKEVLIEAQGALRRGELDALPEATERAISEGELQKVADAETIADLRQKLEATPIDPQLRLGWEDTAIDRGFHVKNRSASQDAFNIKLRDIKGATRILRSEEIECVEAGKAVPFRLNAFPVQEAGGSVVLSVLGGAMNAFLEDLRTTEGARRRFEHVKFLTEIEYADASAQRYLSRSEVTWKPRWDHFSIKHRVILRLS